MTNQLHICESKKVLLHIGFHKTASTWFQKELFSRSELGFHLYKHERSFIHKAFCQTPLYDSPQNPAALSIVKEANETISKGNTFVISHERLSGYPASGGFDAENIARTLKRYFPNASVLFFIREQSSMIFSAWRQQIVDGGGLSLKQFLTPPESNITRTPLFHLGMYEYSKLYKCYVGLFAKENVSCIPYESFCKNPKESLFVIEKLVENEAFREQIGSICNTSSVQNPSISLPILVWQRWMNIVFTRNQLSQNCSVNLGTRNMRAMARILNKYGGSLLCSPADRVMKKFAKKTINQLIQNKYNADNELLSELLQIELAQFKYNC